MLRYELLNKLLNMETSTRTIADELNKLNWDSDNELIELTRKHLINIFEKYISEKINKSEVEDWANAIEVRDDIGRESAYAELIDEILYELANPYLTQDLNKERARTLLTRVNHDR